jgi:hypothetical protein
MLILCASSGSATASSRWVLQRTVTPPGFAYGSLVAVSCTPRLACTAVGSFYNARTVEVPLVERWQGNRWSTQTPVVPARAAAARLDGVSCTSRTSCTAVGSFVDRGGNTLTLVERWDGRRWSLESTPRPGADEGRAFESISCTSQAACTAIGSTGSGWPLVERSNGSNWSVQRTPKPPASEGAAFVGVSCSSDRSCVAVGNYSEASTGCSIPLVERWDGSRWSIQPSPKIGGCFSTDNGLHEISCPSISVCSAVGYDDTRADSYGVGFPLAEGWTRAAWNVQPTPDVTYFEDPWGGGGYLTGVSCTSRTFCVAVGATTSEILTRPLVEQWGRTGWMIESTPSWPQDGALIGVSCPSSNACFAVGYDDSRGTNTDVPLVESTVGRGGPPAVVAPPVTG